MQNALVRLLRRRSPRASHLMFTVYTRRQCCCCHKAFEVLEEARKHHGFSMETVDVDSDSTLAERYGDTVPVVLVDGKVRFRGKVEPALLDRLLTAEARERARPRFRSLSLPGFAIRRRLAGSHPSQAGASPS